MPVPPHSNSKRYHDIEDIPLSPDIEWMLQSRQVGPEVILEALVDEYYPALYEISRTIVGDAELAKDCVRQTLILAVKNSHRYWGKIGVKIWLFNLCVHHCMKRKSWFRFQNEVEAGDNSTSPKADLDSVVNADHLLGEEIWHALGKVKLKERLALIFHYGFEMTAPEIAAVLRSGANTMRSNLLEIKRKFMLQLQNVPGNTYLTEKYLEETLQKRFLHHDRFQVTYGLITTEILEELNQRETKNKHRILIQQFLFVVLVIGLVATISLITNVFAAEPVRRAVVQTVVVTKVVYVTPSLASDEDELSRDMPEMLVEESAIEDILLRMREGQYSWKTLWLDGRVIDYGPPGYTGTPRMRREQVWVSQPANSLVLTGWAGGEVDHIWFALNGKVYDVDIATGHPVLYDFHPDLLPVYSFFEGHIFPRRNEVQTRYTVLGSEQISGRFSIIIDGFNEKNVRAERLWVDAITGVVLRKLQYAGDGESVIFEVVVRQILFDVSFPKNIFNRNDLIKHFSYNYYGEPFPISEEYPIPKRTPAPGHVTITKVPPPVGFDVSESDLRFQWNQAQSSELLAYASLMPSNINDSYGVQMPVSVFADDYFLGELNFNPWRYYCERSADGDNIAISSVYNNEDSIKYTLQVIDLNDFSDVRDISSNITPMDITIAMNPMNEQLTFFGCDPNESVLFCGVYLADFTSEEYSLLYPTDNLYRMFWSPDGIYLAVVMFPTTQAYDAVVIDVEKSRMTFTGNYDYENDRFPLDFPVKNWGKKIAEPGLAACYSP